MLPKNLIQVFTLKWLTESQQNEWKVIQNCMDSCDMSEHLLNYWLNERMGWMGIPSEWPYQIFQLQIPLYEMKPVMSSEVSRFAMAVLLLVNNHKSIMNASVVKGQLQKSLFKKQKK